MIRTLLMIAVAGFLVSAVTLSVAVAIAGPAAIVDGAWSWGPHGWGSRHPEQGRDKAWSRSARGARDDADDGPRTSRDIAWSGGDSLTVSVPADLQFTQANGPGKVTVSGPSGAVADVRVEDGHIRYDGLRDRDDQRLKIVITAPAVTDFTLESDDTFILTNYRQDKLALSVTGHADVKAAGESRNVRIMISGSARADLSGLRTKRATVGISGSGEASLAPTDAADVEITGSGDVTLLTDPPELRTSITGSGEVHRSGAQTAVRS